MGQKTNNRILWHGNGLNAEGKAVAPVKAVAGGDGTDGLNEGELYICNSDSDPALFILTDAGNVVRIDGNGSDTYTREQINEKLNAKVDVAFFSRMFGLMDEEGGEIQVNDVETLASSIKAKLGFWTEQYLSAKGNNPDSGSEVSGATTLAALSDVSITGTPKDGQVLAFDATLNKWTPVDMEATAGIDEEELLQILTQKGYATQQWVTQQSYAKTSVRIKAGTGLTGGGTLAQDVTLSLATVGTAGTYTKVTVDAYGRVTGHSSLAAGDIPALAISKITGLQAALDAKLNKSVFEEMFEKVYVSGYGYAIRAKLAFYSDDWISAKGLNSDAGSTTGGVDKDEVLQIVENAGYIKSSALNGYATQTWASGQFALKTVAINAGTGLTGGGNLSANRTLSLATVGTAGTYTKVTVDAYGRVTGHASLAAGDIPALAISKITGLQTALDAKLNKSVFEELFEKVLVSGYGYAIRAKLALYTDSWMSAKGSNPDAGSVSAGLDEEQLAEYLTTHGYATQNWVNQQGFLKSVAWGDVTGKPAPLANDQYYYGHGQLTTDFNDAVKGGAYFTASEAWPSNGPGTSYRYGALAVFHTGTDNMRVAQLWMSHHSDSDGGVYVRMKYEQADGNWQPWARLLDNNCIGSYALTPSNYTNYTVTKTGGGASGKWGIAVTGNAGSATRLQTARTLWGQSFNGTTNVSGSLSSVGNISLLSNYAYNCGSNGQQWNNVYSRAYNIGNSRGTNYIAEGNGDYASYSTYNLKIHAHWGIGIVDTTDTCRIFMDSRTGSLSAQGTIHADGGMELPYRSGTWLSMATRTELIRGANEQSSGGAHSLFRVTANNGGVLAFGGLGNVIGFFGFSKSNIDNGTNAYSFRAAFDMSNYEFKTNQGISAGTYVQVGSARLMWDSTNNALYVQKSDGTACGFYATGFVSAKGANDDGGDTEATVLTIADERNTAIYPDTYAGRGIRGLFRANATDGLNDGGTYHTVLHIRQWANSSGGLSHQLAFTDNGGVWHRTALSETAWGEWSELSALSGLGDVQISSPTDGQSLVYRNGVWKNETVNYGITMDVDWDDVKNKPAWIGSTKPSYSFSEITGMPSISISSSSGTNLSVTVEGSGRTIPDLYATYLGGTTKQGLFTGLTYSSNKLSVTIGGTTRSVTISGGSSTIPDTLALERLDIEGTANSSAYISANYPNNMYINVGGDNLMTFDGDNTVVTPGASVAGVEDFGSSRFRWRTIYSVNSLNASSDLRLKDVRAAIPLTVAQVAAAPSFLYRWKNGADTALHAGSSAQYWQQALPQAVTEGADGYLAMEYDRIALAAAIATARAVETLDQRVARLEKENKKLRFRIKMLEKR